MYITFTNEYNITAQIYQNIKTVSSVISNIIVTRINDFCVPDDKLYKKSS